jgi:hypothetical protein
MKNKDKKTAKYAINVIKLSDGRRLFSRILKQIQNDEIPESKARLMIYGLKSFADYVSSTELEQQLSEISELEQDQ